MVAEDLENAKRLTNGNNFDCISGLSKMFHYTSTDNKLVSHEDYQHNMFEQFLQHTSMTQLYSRETAVTLTSYRNRP